jgi:hypothetical protein
LESASSLPANFTDVRATLFFYYFAGDYASMGNLFPRVESVGLFRRGSPPRESSPL